MKWILTSDLKEYEGKIIPSKIEGFYFYIVSASVEKGLEIIVKDEFHERYSLFDVTTINSKIAVQLRQEAEEMVFQWCYSVDTSLVALKEQWNRWILEHITPYSAMPFKKSAAKVYNVKENGKWYALMMEIPFSKLGITSDEIALILNVKISPEEKETLLQKEGVFEAYHMNKKHWISIALNVCKDEAFIKECIENSYKCICYKDKFFTFLETFDIIFIT